MTKDVILMVGPQGSGKTTLSKKLDGVRISQDEQGKVTHFTLFKDALLDEEPLIIVDRMNFNRSQRKKYIDLAREHGYTVSIWEIKGEFNICLKRIMEREDHPTIRAGDEELAVKCLKTFWSQYEEPTIDECDNLMRITNMLGI